MEETKDLAKKPEKKKERRSVKAFFKSVYGEYKAEYKKIIWPSRKELFEQTTSVIVVSVIFGLVIVGLDAVLSWGYGLLMGLL